MSGEAILLAFDGPAAGEWRALIAQHARGRDVRMWPDAIGDTKDIGYALVWRAPHGLLATLPHLRAIINLGAGVDHLLADSKLPNVPIARVVHPDLTQRMVQYVVLHVLLYHRRQRLYDTQQRARIWQPHFQPAASDVAVGVMGLGAIGLAAADALVRLGFKVAGWSRTRRDSAGLETFHGRAGLDAFLARTEILVCLLPATMQTDRLLDLDLLRKLKRDGPAGGAFLINASRGRVQVDADILAALDEHILAGATLDVFAHEPLPPQSALWSHPRVTITPHNAGDIAPSAFAAEVIAQIERCERGQPLDNVIDRTRGY